MPAPKWHGGDFPTCPRFWRLVVFHFTSMAFPQTALVGKDAAAGNIQIHCQRISYLSGLLISPVLYYSVCILPEKFLYSRG